MTDSRSQKKTNSTRLIRTMLLGVFLFVLTTAGNAQVLQPEPLHGQVNKTVSRLLSRFHYSQLELNDSLSSEIYDRYIKRLDPGKNYFLASDIARFEKYRQRMDENIFSGNLDPAFEIFNVLKRSVKARLDNIQSVLI